MPIYEYYCPDNNRIYQFFAKTRAQAESTPTCPDNPKFRMQKIVSGFAIGGGVRKSGGDEKPASPGDAEAGGADPGNPADDARMESAMAQMEREMSSVDENDPRAMGRMMRRMSELTGEKLDGEMEEMVRKLEEGADPETIEEQMGGPMGEEGEGDDAYGGGGMGGGYGRAPSRDPNLYDY